MKTSKFFRLGSALAVLMAFSTISNAANYDPISLLSDYAIITSGDVSGKGAIGSSGGLLVGGSLTGKTDIYGGGNAYINGNIDGKLTNWNGQTQYGGAVTGVTNGGVTTQQGSSLATDAVSALTQYSGQLAGMQSNATQGLGANGWDPRVATFSTAADHTGIAVFNVVDAAAFFEQAQNINFNLSAGTSSVLVNLFGDDAVTINSGFWNSSAVAGNIVWNFAEASEIDFLGQNFYGTVLAMGADVSNSNQFFGSLAARSLFQDGQVNPLDLNFDEPYRGSVPGVAAVPVPSSLPLFLSGLIGFTAFRRYQQKSSETKGL